MEQTGRVSAWESRALELAPRRDLDPARTLSSFSSFTGKFTELRSSILGWTSSERRSVTYVRRRLRLGALAGLLADPEGSVRSRTKADEGHSQCGSEDTGFVARQGNGRSTPKRATPARTVLEIIDVADLTRSATTNARAHGAIRIHGAAGP